MYQSYCESQSISSSERYSGSFSRRGMTMIKPKLPVKRITALLVCLFLLFCILGYSFVNYIYDVLPSNSLKHLHINYEKLMYPASNMHADTARGRSIPVLKASYSGNPVMADIPEMRERIGLRNELLRLADKYKRIHPAVYVWEYEGKSYAAINADEPFPAASIIKVPVLIELFRSIERGKFSLYDTMVFEDYYRAEGSGRLKYSEGGRRHTLDRLARIMIENSDNSSTNMLMSKIGGMPDVNFAIKSWGLKTTGINSWLPDMGGTNLTSARETAKMFYNLDLTNIVSGDSKRYIASYLGHVKNTRLLKAGLPADAKILHKTGDIGYMLGDAGIVKAANGRKYIVVILARRPYNNLQGKEFIVKASKLIYENIALE